MSEDRTEIISKLIAIQSELKVPKKRVNSFSGFNFRNVDDILEVAKPICQKYGCALTLTDKMILIGDRFYVEATATLFDGKTSISTNASAREECSKKGFDAAQITGAASSYARKYALNGLLGLDDSDDPDNHDNRETSEYNVNCPRCGKPVEGYIGTTGYTYSPGEVINKYGMCLDCYRKTKNA